MSSLWLTHPQRTEDMDRFNNHVKKCEKLGSKFKKDFISSREALQYCPHILNNLVYIYCHFYDIECFQTIHYITYDFETMEQNIEKKVIDKSVINFRLIPLSTSSCVKLDKGLITKIFDIRTNEFITKWIDWLFVIGCDVYVDKLNHLKSFIRGKSEEELNKIDTSLKTIIVLGFKFIKF